MENFMDFREVTITPLIVLVFAAAGVSWYWRIT
jgi:hypothetical protein